MAFLGEIIEEAIIRLDGRDEIYGIANITIPDVEHKTETITGMGVIEHEKVIATAFNAMSTTIKFINRNKGISLPHDNINLTATAAITGVNKDTHEYEQQKAVYSFKGKKKKTSGGDLGKAVKNETEIEIALTYYKEEIDGVIVHEIDVYNRKAIINGIDFYENIRKVLS